MNSVKKRDIVWALLRKCGYTYLQASTMCVAVDPGRVGRSGLVVLAMQVARQSTASLSSAARSGVCNRFRKASNCLFSNQVVSAFVAEKCSNADCPIAGSSSIDGLAETVCVTDAENSVSVGGDQGGARCVPRL